MKFGIFEHMDEAGIPLTQHYENRLKLVEAYDRQGFYAYHLAEHHGTPLGLAPSPGIFLAAVAQRTRRLRFGPLSYSLPLYHPVRLLEEICMLDQMSGGRFELGVGRGVSPFEVGFYNADPVAGLKQFPEMLQLLKKGLSSEELNFDGEFYKFSKVPMILRPVQKPYPPLWYGILSMDSAKWAAVESAHMVTLVPPAPARGFIDRYKQEWSALGRAEDKLPLLGISRHVVLAETEAEARKVAERAYRPWVKHMELLWVKNGTTLPLGLPPEFAQIEQAGAAYAGTPAGFIEYVKAQEAATGATYFVCDVAFGDLSYEESLRTVNLLGEKVLPAFA